MTEVAILDHGMGNLRSVSKALEKAGATTVVTDDVARIENCDALCVPGQGIFGRCMSSLSESRLDGPVREWIASGRPYLGICLGMQILFEWSEEDSCDGLGVLKGRVERLRGEVPVPHIGWNEVNSEHFYFDHSYAVHPSDPAIVDGWCEHGERFAASIASDALKGVQFHPEKSSNAGLQLLHDWLDAL